MKRVTATFTMTIDLTDTIEEMEKGGEEISDLRDFVVSCMQEDLQDLSNFKSDVKSHTHVVIDMGGDCTHCQSCGENITWEDYGRNMGLCMECVATIQ